MQTAIIGAGNHAASIRRRIMLTPKQQLFVAEYLVSLNATQAAIRAGYSERTANEQGARLLANVSVWAAIEAGMSKRADKVELTAERVIREIMTMAFWDPAELAEIMRPVTDDEVDNMSAEQRGAIVTLDGKRFTLDGIYSPRDFKLLPEGFRRAIVGWSWDRNQNFTLKLADKSKALDQLARHLSLYNDRLEVGGLDALGDRLERALKRAG